MPVIMAIISIGIVVVIVASFASQTDIDKGNPPGTEIRGIVSELSREFFGNPIVQFLMLVALLVVMTVLAVLAAIYSALTG